MNSLVKSLLWIIAAVVALFFGIRFQKDREIAELQTEYQSIASRAKSLNTDTALVQAKLEQAMGDSTAGSEFESKYMASIANIASEQKKIDELINKWPGVEAERLAAVQAVREQESTKPPYSLTLADGTKLENFVVRSVPDEKTISAEHSSGLVKVAAENLPEALRARLGFGWKSEPPASMSIDKNGNAVVKQAVKDAEQQVENDKAAKELGLANAGDTNTLSGVTKALAVTESMLSKALVAMEAERANIRKLDIFKPNLMGPGGKTYAVLKKEANDRLAGLAGRVQALRAERNNLQHKMKSF